jgi:hypothetical protein
MPAVWTGSGPPTRVVLGEAGSPMTVRSLPARGRPPQVAARRAGLELDAGGHKLCGEQRLELVGEVVAGPLSGLGRGDRLDCGQLGFELFPSGEGRSSGKASNVSVVVVHSL